MSTIFTLQKSRVERHKGSEILRSVKIFFGIRIGSTYTKSRIIRKPTKSYEEFIFKGYNQLDPEASTPASFKKIRIISKN